MPQTDKLDSLYPVILVYDALDRVSKHCKLDAFLLSVEYINQFIFLICRCLQDHGKHKILSLLAFGRQSA